MSNKLKIKISTDKSKKIEVRNNNTNEKIEPTPYIHVPDSTNELAFVYWHDNSQCVTFVILGKQFQV